MAKKFKFIDTANGKEEARSTPPAGLIGGSAQKASDTADTTTTSATDVLAASMTLTPVAGTYLVYFVGSMEISTSNKNGFMSIWKNGVQVAESEVRIAPQASAPYAFNAMAKVTVDGTQAIEGRWRVSGGTGTMHQRQLMLL